MDSGPLVVQPLRKHSALLLNSKSVLEAYLLLPQLSKMKSLTIIVNG